MLCARVVGLVVATPKADELEGVRFAVLQPLGASLAPRGRRLVAVDTVGGATASTSPTTGSTGDCPWVGSTAPIATRVSQVLARMTLDQKVSILHGNGASSPYIGDLTGGVLGSNYQDIFAFIVLIVMLTLRPQGLLGERVADRA